jgi:hypothetical protein
MCCCHMQCNYNSGMSAAQLFHLTVHNDRRKPRKHSSTDITACGNDGQTSEMPRLKLLGDRTASFNTTYSDVVYPTTRLFTVVRPPRKDMYIEQRRNTKPAEIHVYKWQHFEFKFIEMDIIFF